MDVSQVVNLLTDAIDILKKGKDETPPTLKLVFNKNNQILSFNPIKSNFSVNSIKIDDETTTINFKEAGKEYLITGVVCDPQFKKCDFNEISCSGDLGNFFTGSYQNMFEKCSFENGKVDIGKFTLNTSSISKMFASAKFGKDQKWIEKLECTSKVTDMSYMFFNATSFNHPLGNKNWDTSSVTNMRQMFDNAASFNQPFGEN